MLKIEIKTSGAAFCDPFTGEPDPYYAEMETARIIEEQVLPLLKNGVTSRNLRDINGNIVGKMDTV